VRVREPRRTIFGASCTQPSPPTPPAKREREVMGKEERIGRKATSPPLADPRPTALGNPARLANSAPPGAARRAICPDRQSPGRRRLAPRGRARDGRPAPPARSVPWRRPRRVEAMAPVPATRRSCSLAPTAAPRAPAPMGPERVAARMVRNPDPTRLGDPARSATITASRTQRAAAFWLFRAGLYRPDTARAGSSTASSHDGPAFRTLLVAGEGRWGMPPRSWRCPSSSAATPTPTLPRKRRKEVEAGRPS